MVHREVTVMVYKWRRVAQTHAQGYFKGGGARDSPPPPPPKMACHPEISQDHS